MWMLVLGACVSLVVGTDCGKECALCVYRLLGQQSGFSSLVMSLDLNNTIKLIYISNTLGDKLIVDKMKSVRLQRQPVVSMANFYQELINFLYRN